jgi:hypothetical protein
VPLLSRFGINSVSSEFFMRMLKPLPDGWWALDDREFKHRPKSFKTFLNTRRFICSVSSPRGVWLAEIVKFLRDAVIRRRPGP